MFLVVSKRFLAVQAETSACWVSAAHFVLGYCGVNTTLGKLLSTYYVRPAGAGAATAVAGLGAGAASAASSSAALAASMATQMQGAGKPKTILADYASETRRVVGKVQVNRVLLSALVDRITRSIDADTPVIAVMYSNLEKWAHALVIVGIDVKGTRIAFKDPAQGDAVTVEDIKSFFTHPGFLYKKDYRDKLTGITTDVRAYCKFLTTYDERAPAAAAAATTAAAAGAAPTIVTASAALPVPPRLSGHTTPGLGLGGLGAGAGGGIKPP